MVEVRLTSYVEKEGWLRSGVFVMWSRMDG